MSKIFSKIKLKVLFVATLLVATLCMGFGFMTAPAKAEPNDNLFEMEDTASLRLDEENGLRFKAKLGQNTYDRIDDVTTKLYFIIMPAEYFDDVDKDDYEQVYEQAIVRDADGEFDEEKSHCLYVQVPKGNIGKYDEADEYFVAHAGVSPVNSANYGMDFVAVACLEMFEGENTYSYEYAAPQTEAYGMPTTSLYDTVITAVLYDGEDYIAEIADNDDYAWFGGEEFPVEIKDDAEYAKLKAKKGDSFFTDKTIKISDKVESYDVADFAGSAINTEDVKIFYTVEFVNEKGESMKVQKLTAGEMPVAPAHSELAGYTFSWDKELAEVSESVVYTETKTENPVDYKNLDFAELKYLPSGLHLEQTSNGQSMNYDSKENALCLSTWGNISVLFPQAISCENAYVLEIVFKTPADSLKIQTGWQDKYSENPAIHEYHTVNILYAANAQIGSIQFYPEGTKTIYVKSIKLVEVPTVTLNNLENATCDALTYYIEGVGATLPVPTKAGYTFGGWFADSEFTGDAVTAISETDTGNKTFYAKWTENPVDYKNLDFAELKYLPSGITLAGVGTNGHYDATEDALYLTAAQNGNIEINFKQAISCEKAYVLEIVFKTAIATKVDIKTAWQDKYSENPAIHEYHTVNILYAANAQIGSIQLVMDGSAKTTYIKSIKLVEVPTVTLNNLENATCDALTYYIEGVGATLPVPTKAGYTFGGWFANSEFTGDAVTAISETDTGNKTFYAKWTERSVDYKNLDFAELKYLPSGITLAGNGTNGHYDATEDALYLTAASNGNIEINFKQVISCEKAYVLEIVFKTAIANNVDIKTGWTQKYNENPAIHEYHTVNILYAANAQIGSIQLVMDGSAKTTYIKSIKLVEVPTVTLNNLENATCDALTYYIEGVGATLPVPTKAGYTFGGWFADSEFTGDAVTAISETDTGNKTFYAKWTERSVDYKNLDFAELKYLPSGITLAGNGTNGHYDATEDALYLTAASNGNIEINFKQAISCEKAYVLEIVFKTAIATNVYIKTGWQDKYNENPAIHEYHTVQIPYAANAQIGSIQLVMDGSAKTTYIKSIKLVERPVVVVGNEGVDFSTFVTAPAGLSNLDSIATLKTIGEKQYLAFENVAKGNGSAGLILNFNALTGCKVKISMIIQLVSGTQSNRGGMWNGVFTGGWLVDIPQGNITSACNEYTYELNFAEKTLSCLWIDGNVDGCVYNYYISKIEVIPV